MTERGEWWERSVSVSRDPWPMRHHVTKRFGEWRGFYLKDGETTERGYETDEEFVEICIHHLQEQPCRVCEAAALGIDEGDE